MKLIDKMETNENLGWCRPYFISTEDNDIFLVMAEDGIAGIMVNDSEWNMMGRTKNGLYPRYSDDQILKLAHVIYGDDCDLTWDVVGDILESAQEIGCRECPWCKSCEPMQEEVEE